MGVLQLSGDVPHSEVHEKYKCTTLSDKRITDPRESMKPKKKVASSSRFSKEHYSLGNTTACPLCESMVSKANYSRHIKQAHNYEGTTEEFIKEHEAKTLEVLEREKAGTIRD